MGRSFDVEDINWTQGKTESFKVDDVAVLQNRVRIPELFPGVEFVRYHFSSQQKNAPLVIVSFSGGNCVIHRINRGDGQSFGPKGLAELVTLVLRHVSRKENVKRVWTSIHNQTHLKGIDKNSNSFKQLARDFRILQEVAKRKGFRVRRFWHPKEPQIIRLLSPLGEKPTVLWLGKKPSRNTVKKGLVK